MKLLKRLIIIMSIILIACNQNGKSGHQPVDPKASTATVNFYSRLKTLVNKGIMIGHQDDLAYGVKWKAPNGKSDIYDICSDYPAVFGWDLGHLELGNAYNLDSVPFSEMAKFAVEVDSKGGINTFSWHCNNPLTGGNAWDIKTPGVVKSILPGGIKHDEFNQWLDKVSNFLSSIKNVEGEPIPVIFRPFHEQTGSWFWWGKDHCSAEEFMKLWQYTFNYLTITKNVHNLIFAYSTDGSISDSSEFLARYPGNEFVDIIGFDIYQGVEQSNPDFANELTERLKILMEVALSKNKIPAITEIGYEQIPYPTWWTEVLFPALKDHPVSYALFWRNAINRPNHYYVPYPGQQSETDFKNFYILPQTLFLKDLGI